MDAKEKLAALRAGKRITTSDGKTTHSYRQGKTTVTKSAGKTTTTTKKGQGWTIDSGTQKKTIAPKHKASPKSTAGRSIKYHGGKSNVVDLGHNPTKSAVSKATVKLNKAKAVAKPKAKKNTASTTPTIKIPQEGAPTVPTSAKSDSGSGFSLGGAAVATGLAAGTAVGVHKLLKAPTAPQKAAAPPKAKPPRPGEDPKQIKLPAAPKGLPGRPKRVGLPKPPLGLPGPPKGKIEYNPPINLPKSPKGLPGDRRPTLVAPEEPKKPPTRKQIVDDIRSKSAPKVAKVVVPKELPKTPTTVKVRGIDVSAADIADQRPKNIIRTTMDNAGKRTTKITTGTKMEDVQLEADKRVGDERRGGGSRRSASRMTKKQAGVESGAGYREGSPVAPKQSSRRKAGQRRAPVESDATIALKEAGILPDTVEAPKAAKVEVPVEGGGTPKANPEGVGRLPTAPHMGGRAANQGAPLAIVRGVNVPGAPSTAEPKVAKVEVPKVKTITTGTGFDGQPLKAEVPKVGRIDTAPKVDPKLKKELDKERAKNAKLIAAQPADQKQVELELKKTEAKVAKVEPPKTSAPVAETPPADATRAAGDLRGVAVEQAPVSDEAVKSARESAAKKSFYRKQGAARRTARDASIAEKGIMTIPETGEIDSEVAQVKQKALERDLLDATVAEEGPGKKATPAKAVGSATDKRTAAQIVGTEAVEAKVRVMEPGPRDLETEHGGGRQQGTIADIINQDTDMRDARNEDVRRAANKARAIAASRDATPEQEAKLDKAIQGEYDRSLELYFDDVETDADPKNQRGPRKPDARPRIMDSMIDADAELAKARDSASPPAPADRTTVDQKIALINERMAPGGEAIYKGKESIDMLESLRDTGVAEVKPPKRSLALPPAQDLLTEQEAGSKRGRTAARVQGAEAGQAAAAAKAATGAAGPPEVPRMGPRIVTTDTGEAKALQGKQAGIPPATPPVERGVVSTPPKTMAQLWTGRMADWGRSAYQAQVKRLSAPYLDVAGADAKATGKASAKAKAAAGVKGLGLATLAFTALGAGESYAAEHDPKKKLGAAGEQFKADLPEVGKSIVKFTAADYGVTKVIPAVVKKIATTLGANATRSAFAAGASATIGRLGLAGYIGYHALPYTGKKLAELAHSAVEARKAGAEATDKRKKSEAKYGTVELATKTRHAKEAEKRRKAADKKGII